MTSEESKSASRPHYSENPSLFPLDGGCPCGQVRYRILSAPLIVKCCYCTACQRALSGLCAYYAVLETSLVERLPPVKAFIPTSRSRPDEAPLPAGPPVVPASAQDSADNGK